MRTVITTNYEGRNFCYFFRPYENNGVCSNWYESDFVEDGIKFNCVEKYMMYKKAMLFNDTNTADKILATDNPKTIKALGREVRNFNEAVWKAHREEIVYRGVLAKFSQSIQLKSWMKKLYATYKDSILFVEASPYDRIWGIGIEASSNANNLAEQDFRGMNLLGKALTRVYNEIGIGKNYG